METMMTNVYEQEQTCLRMLNQFEQELHDFKNFIKSRKPKNWLILATGSSANAIISAKYYIEKIAGVFIEIKEPFNFTHYEKVNDYTDFVLAVSQSGKSHSTIEALKKIQSSSEIPTAVLTSRLNSPITDYADMVIDIGCGIEKVGFVTKGFTATMLKSMLMGVIAGQKLHHINEKTTELEIKKFYEIVNRIPSIIKKTEDFYKRHAQELHSIPRFAAIGYGPAVGTAKECETKFTETIRVPTHGFELEAFMHGPYLEVNDKYGLFFIQTQSILSKRAKQLKDYFSSYTDHCFTIECGNNEEEEKTLSLGTDIDELLCPLVMSIPFQILAYRIAAGRGIDLNTPIFHDFDQFLKSKV